MRRVPLVLLTLLTSTTLASAQTPAPVNPDIVVVRLMTFDSDHDGRIVKGELPERMQNVLAADASGDGALDRAEIRALSQPASPRAVRTVTTVPGFPGGYVLSSSVSLSTGAHVEGVLDDLRLDNYTRDQALAVTRKFMDRLETNASVAFIKTLTPLMTPAQLESVRATLDRQFGHRAAPAVISRADTAIVPNGLAKAPNGNVVTTFFVGAGNLESLIQRAGLQPEQNKQAQAALELLKEQLRPGDAERPVLLKQLTSVLSDEERDNFGAALARRAVVKAGPMEMFKLLEGVVPGTGDIGIVRDGVFRTPLPSPRVLEP